MSAHRQHEEGKGDSFTYLGRVLCVRIVSFTRLCTVLLEGHRVVMFLNVTNQPDGGARNLIGADWLLWSWRRAEPLFVAMLESGVHFLATCPTGFR